MFDSRKQHRIIDL